MPTLYDHRGRPVQTKHLTEEIAAPRMTGVRSPWTNDVVAGMTPGRLGAIIRAANNNDHYDFLTMAEEMEERDGHYRSVLGTRKRAVTGIEIVVTAGDESARAVELADEVRAIFRRPEFKSMCDHLLDALGKGYAVSEILWDRSARQWSPKGYEDVDPRFFTFDLVRRRELRLRDETAPMDGLPLEPFKFLTHVPRLKSGLPIRNGLARVAAWNYLFKNFAIKDWMAFAEIFGIPMRLGKYEPGASQDDIDTLITAVANLGSDAAAVIPRTMTLEILEAAGGQGSHELFGSLVDLLDKQTSKAVLGQTMTTDDGSSLGQAKVHNEVRLDIVEADGEQLAATINQFLVKPYIDLNHGPQEAYPSIEIVPPRSEDIEALSTAVEKMGPQGLTLRSSEVRERLGFSAPDEGDEVIGGRPEAPLGEATNRHDGSLRSEIIDVVRTAVGAGLAEATNRSGTESRADELIDELIDEADSDWQSVMDGVVDPIRRLVDEADSFEDLKARLADAYPLLDERALVRVLGELMFRARGIGDAVPED